MVPTTFAPVTTRTDQKAAHAMDSFVSKAAPVPAILKNSVNVYDLTVDERRGLLDGPKAEIYIETTRAFRNAPIRALMAWSPKANAHFRANPLSRKVAFPASAADVSAVQNVLRATVTHAGMGKDALGAVFPGNTLTDAVKNYQAALTLGVKRRVEHIAKAIAGHISAGLLSYEAVTLIATCVPPSDEVFHYLAHNLATRRFQRQIPDPEDFEKYLETMPKLKEAMAEIDAPHQAERKAHKDAAAEARARKQAKEERSKHREYKGRVEALKVKLNAAMGGIVSMTQEEADLRRELGI